jgi:hypothetical protein
MTPNTHSDTIAPRQKTKVTRASAEERNNKAAACEAFDTLFDERDSAAVPRFWFPYYVQHSAHDELGRDGVFGLVKCPCSKTHFPLDPGSGAPGHHMPHIVRRATTRNDAP